ncbi:M23 family metallopeptidase [Vagococcus fluvialis]|jgi:hypothetical protein|uniref:M23 family metallopeptidase n=1 Tax=Vagococcus fluvialis TaxID=2738 RepID=UPI001A8EF815|nr:M23 family metallopeptidase [Vagococcus fluvialis]MBO0427636.1 M23 family metallopeptidase [Vagococcus fluvialis]
MGKYWGWPNVKAYLGYYEEGQQFGFTKFDRTGYGDYFHDGFDFGSAKYPDKRILAIHDGTVIYAGWAPRGYEALGTVIVTRGTDGYYIVYQEFGTSTSDIKVSVGQNVKMGQVIGNRATNHMHLGITKKEWLAAQQSAFKNDGTWLDPIKIIQEDKGTKPAEDNHYQSGNYFVALQDLKTYNRDFSKEDTTWFFKKGSKIAVREIVKMPNGATHALIAGLGDTYVTLNKSYVKPQ